MKPNQEETEALLREKAAARLPRLLVAKQKLEEKIAKAGPEQKGKVAGWKARVAEYDEDIASVEAGSYRGYNGKPFGATPGIIKGLL